MKVRIIVDSTADMAPRYRGRAAVAPLTIHFGGEELIDGVSIDRRRFYERLVESDELPTTSQASPPCFSSSMRTRSGRGEHGGHHHLLEALRNLPERLPCGGGL